MADVLFTTGTSPKNQMYTKMVEAFIAAGWTNISTNPTVDFDVLQSRGESGDKLLTIQMRPSSITNTNSTLTTDFNICSYRLIESYTPGANSGVAGVFGRPTEVWTPFYIVPLATAVAGATVLTYHINVNKNRMIIVIDTPPAISTAPVTLYMGLPDALFASEPGSRGLLVATSCTAKGATSVNVTNTPEEVASETVSSLRTIYCQLSPKNPNSAGLYAISEMKYGSTIEGYRGKLNGIFTMPVGGVSNGDVIIMGSKQFRVVVNQTLGASSFPSTTLAIQIV